MVLDVLENRWLAGAIIHRDQFCLDLSSGVTRARAVDWGLPAWRPKNNTSISMGASSPMAVLRVSRACNNSQLV